MTESNIAYNKYKGSRNDTYITFNTTKYITKSLKMFYKATQSQLKIICDEVFYWDGAIDENRKHKYFSSTDKENADVIQFAFTANEIRTGISIIDNSKKKDNWKPNYIVCPTKNNYVEFNTRINKVKSIDGFKYCFNTTTGAFVARRNNRIFLTGNCGMRAVKLADKSIDLPNLDSVIHKYVPAGFDIHKEAIASSRVADILAPVNIDKALKSLGTLGGGKPFYWCDTFLTEKVRH